MSTSVRESPLGRPAFRASAGLASSAAPPATAGMPLPAYCSGCAGFHTRTSTTTAPAASTAAKMSASWYGA